MGRAFRHEVYKNSTPPPYFPTVCFNFYIFLSATVLEAYMWGAKTFAKSSFCTPHVGDYPNNKMNIKIETDQKILYNGINLA